MKGSIGCPCCGINDTDPDFMAKLRNFERELGREIEITSMCRCEHHNAELKDSATNSEHLCGNGKRTQGVDIKAISGIEKYQIITVGLKYFNRIGVGKTFVHLGGSKVLPQKVIWSY